MTTIQVYNGDGIPFSEPLSLDEALEIVTCWSQEIDQTYFSPGKECQRPAPHQQQVLIRVIEGWENLTELPEDASVAHTLIDDTSKAIRIIRTTSAPTPWSDSELDLIEVALGEIWKHTEPPF